MSESAELTLDRVSRAQAGVYQCRADNGVGEPQYRKIELLVTCES